MGRVGLAHFSDIEFETIIEQIKVSDGRAIFVFSCGYEERSLTQYLRLREAIPKEKMKFLCFGFTSYKNSGARPANDRILLEDGIETIEIDTSNWELARETIKACIGDDGKLPIYIDYSSMPRNWYCMLAEKATHFEFKNRVVFIYTHGEYFQEQYPCVGYGEFHKFSGRPNITSTKEINVFGLGFDSTRTHGIWTYLDPQLSVSVIAKSKNNQDHQKRVLLENPEIISASESIVEVNIDKFSDTISTLVDLTRKLLPYGDVALVPDGPKPLVLAMSLVPIYLNKAGVYCWHVGHVKPEGYEPINVRSSGEFFGFGIL